MEVDAKRQRVALTMRMSDTPGQATRGGARPDGGGGGGGGGGRPQGRDRDMRGAGASRAQAAPPAGGALAAAFAKHKSK